MDYLPLPLEIVVACRVTIKWTDLVYRMGANATRKFKIDRCIDRLVYSIREELTRVRCTGGPLLIPRNISKNDWFL